MKTIAILLSTLFLAGCFHKHTPIRAPKFPDAPPSLFEDVGTLKTIKEQKP